jgi:hypothetical protein
MGSDVSASTFTSEIRSDPDFKSPLICAWTVSFLTDGKDGKLILRLDDSITKEINANAGFMDLKRISSGEPVPVFDRPLEVEFRGTVTL